MPFESISENQRSSFLRALTTGHYTLLLGSGISTDSRNARGLLPTANQLRVDLCRLKGAPEGTQLQTVFSTLTPDEIREHVTERFLNCTPGPSLKKFPSFLWRRAFTFNIDDAFEAVYSNASSLQSLVSYNYDDPYVDSRTLTSLSLVHLHGYTQLDDRKYVFSRNQYIQQINEHNPWMMILAQTISSDPVIVIGSSLDEVDLDYYLSRRTSTSGRADEGPSIYVSPNSDVITRHYCDLHGMLHFVGTCEEFLNYCDGEAPARPTPIELVPRASKSFLPISIPDKEALAFWSDFELVPGTADSEKELSRFLYGHAPSWADLAADLDVARPVSAQIIEAVEGKLSNPKDPCKLLILFETPGGGKTTILYRCAFELAKQGIATLRCTSLSRLEPATTTKILSEISEPLVIIVDNFADQVTSFQAILDEVGEKNVVILAAERSYRMKYIGQALSGIRYHSYSARKLSQDEVSKLLRNYIKFGVVGESRAISKQESFLGELTGDPIAVACCRILSDFRPLDRIIVSLVEESTELDLRRYLMAALARHCFSGGVRYSVLAGTYKTGGINTHFRRDHPLPLAFFVNDGGGGFVIPQNTTLANHMLEIVSRDRQEDLLEVFVDLGNAIAPRVNRQTIAQRSPEARLAGRLFDFDDVVERFLGQRAQTFYERTQDEWQWNSRYWEQVAQLHLATYHGAMGSARGQQALEQAIQHARHAVSIETHSFPLTTLAQTLIAKMTSNNVLDNTAYEEALEKLLLAIRLERNRARMSVHPFVTLFRGSRIFLDEGGRLSGDNAEKLRSHIREAREQFPRDSEIKERGDALWSCLK